MSIQVTQSSMPSFEEYCKEIEELWESHWLTNMGKKHKQLQLQLERYLDTKYIELLVNGHMALEMTLQAMDFPKGGEVITTPFTFASTIHAIVRNGLTPVFCDIDPNSYTIDPKKIEELITGKTCAILPVHVYGNFCDVDAIDTIAKTHGLCVIYDAAHAFGETYKGVGVANFGEASCFSFHATKVFHTVEGGAVAYSDPSLGEKLYNLKNFGIRGPESVVSIGANAKMSELSAAMGICNLRHIDDEIAKREKADQLYRERLDGISGVTLNVVQPEVRRNYAYFPIRIHPEEYGEDRNTVYKRLAEQGIYARKYFYPLANEYECYRDIFDYHVTPIAREISREVLTLPIFADIEETIIERICAQIVGK